MAKTLFLIFLCSFVFTKEDQKSFFLNNLKGKSEQKQISLLKRKLGHDATGDRHRWTSKHIAHFLELTTEKAEGLSFVIELISDKNNHNSFKKVALPKLISYCKKESKKCFKPLFNDLKCQGETFCDEVHTQLLGLLNSNNLDFITENREVIKKTLLYNYQKVENKKIAFIQATDFGFYPEAKVILSNLGKQKKENPLISYYQCNLMYLENHLSKAKKCFSSLTGEWAVIAESYVSYLMGDKYDQEKLDKAIKKALNSTAIESRLAAIVFSSLLLSLVPEEAKSLEINQISSDYMFGFMLLSLDQNMNFLPKEQKKVFANEFSEHFPESLLLSIYNGKLSFTEVKKKMQLSQNSIIMQVIKKMEIKRN